MSSILKKTTLITIFSITLTTSITTILWAAYRGFDFSDEGFYLQGYTSSYTYPYFSSYYNYLVKGLFFWMHLDVVNIRLLRFFSTSISAIFLSIGIYQFSFSSQKKIFSIEFYLSTCTILSINYMGYTFGPQSLSYNSIEQFLMQFYAAFILLFLSNIKKTNTKLATLNIFISGIILAFISTVKISSMALTLLSTISLIGIYTFDGGIHAKLRYLTQYGLGAISGLLILNFLVKNPIEMLHYLIASSKVQMTISGYTKIELIKGLIISLINLFIILWYPFSFVFLHHLSKSNTRNKKQKILTITTISTIIGIIICTKYHPYLDIINTKFSILIYLFTSSIIFYVIFKIKVNGLILLKSNHIHVTLFLFTLPIFGIIGTNGNYLILANFYSSLFISALLIFILHEYNFKHFKTLVLLGFISLSTPAIYFKIVKDPYRTDDLTTQTVELKNFDRAKGIKLDRECVTFLEKLHNILIDNGYKKGDEIIGAFMIPGLIYLLEGKSLGGILWSEESSAFFFLNLNTKKPLVQLPILIISEKISSHFSSKLKYHGIDIQNNYKKVDSAFYKKNYTVYFPKKTL